MTHDYCLPLFSLALGGEKREEKTEEVDPDAAEEDGIVPRQGPLRSLLPGPKVARRQTVRP